MITPRISELALSTYLCRNQDCRDIPVAPSVSLHIGPILPCILMFHVVVSGNAIVFHLSRLPYRSESSGLGRLHGRLRKLLPILGNSFFQLWGTMSFPVVKNPSMVWCNTIPAYLPVQSRLQFPFRLAGIAKYFLFNSSIVFSWRSCIQRRTFQPH